MQALHWLFQQTGNAVEAGVESCYLCGASCAQTHHVGKAIADTFNSHFLAQRRSSSYLCDACAWYLDSKAGHPDFRKMSLIVAEHSWRQWQRIEMKADIERWLRDGLEEDGYLVVSLTKKKHILLQAPLNAGGVLSGLAIQVEEQVAYVGAASWQQIGHPFMALLALGHGKGEILSGELYAHTLRKHGRLREAIQWSKQLDQWRDSALIELYSYVTILEEKGQEHDEPGGGDGIISERSGDATNRYGVSVAPGGLEVHQPGIQKPVSSGDLAAIRGAHRHGSTNDRDLASVSQSSLWDASDSESGD